MQELRATRRPDGSIELENLSPLLVTMLAELPALLDDDQPERVSQRLYPMPTDDAEHGEEWRRLVQPDLVHLVATARDLVASDLARLVRPDGLGLADRIDIPANHVPGWISALNAARLTLSELYDVGQAEMDHEGLVMEDVTSRAAAKIHLLGWLQQVLIECHCPEDEPNLGRDAEPES